MPYIDKEKHRQQQRRYYHLHPDKMRESARKWKEKNREKMKLWYQEYRERNIEKRRMMDREQAAELKLFVFKVYSDGEPQCSCCGERRMIFLTIDHINNDGAEHRRKIGRKGGEHLYRWLKQNNFPPGFQVLCMNCNFAKSHGGCPHMNEMKL